MDEEGRPFRGGLFVGLILEYNARFGDPATQRLPPLLRAPCPPRYDSSMSRHMISLCGQRPR